MRIPFPEQPWFGTPPAEFYDACVLRSPNHILGGEGIRRARGIVLLEVKGLRRALIRHNESPSFRRTLTCHACLIWGETLGEIEYLKVHGKDLDEYRQEAMMVAQRSALTAGGGIVFGTPHDLVEAQANYSTYFFQFVPFRFFTESA